MFKPTNAPDLDESVSRFEKSLQEAEKRMSKVRLLAADLEEWFNHKTGRVELRPRQTPTTTAYDFRLVDTTTVNEAGNRIERPTTPVPQRDQRDVLEDIFTTLDDALTIECEEPVEPPSKPHIEIQRIQSLPRVDVAELLARKQKMPPHFNDEYWRQLTPSQRRRRRQRTKHNNKKQQQQQ